MIKYHNIVSFDYQRYLHFLTEVEKHRILKFVKPNDIKLGISGIFLIRVLTGTRKEIIRTNKPFIAGLPGNFNISHHKNYAIGIYSRLSLVGIDVTLVDSEIIHCLNAFENTFTVNEWAYINYDIPSRFAAIWALKEAYLKSTGEGMSIDLKRVEFTISSHPLTVSKSKAYLNEISYISLMVDNTAILDYYFEVWMLDEEHLVAVAIKNLNSNEFSIPVHKQSLKFSELEILGISDLPN